VNRRQLALIVILNALISLTIALLVVWVMESRRPDPEELAAIAGAATLLSGGQSGEPAVDLPPTATTSATGESQPAAAQETGEAAAEAAPAGASEQAATGDEEVYVVQPGETLSGIATKLGVTVQALVEFNGLDNADFVFSGQRLKVPSGNPRATPTPPSVALGTTGLTIRSIAGAGDLASEAVEVVNDTDLVFNLQGWRLQRAGGPEYVFGDLNVFPGASVRLHTTSGTDNTIERYWAQPAALWSRGATAVLVNAQGERVAEYAVP
jgi:LysM repeat protein